MNKNTEPRTHVSINAYLNKDLYIKVRQILLAQGSNVSKWITSKMEELVKENHD